MGFSTGQKNQDELAVLIGLFATADIQSNSAVVLGLYADDSNQECYSVAIWTRSETEVKHDNAVIVSATGCMLPIA